MKAYLNPISAVFEHFSSSEKGLTASEAQKRIEKYGKNKLVEAKKETKYEMKILCFFFIL